MQGALAAAVVASLGKMVSPASFGAGAQWFPETTALTYALKGALAAAGPEVRLLLKGSRFNRLERVVDALAGTSGATMGGH